MIINPLHNAYAPQPQSGQTTLQAQSRHAMAQAQQTAAATGEQVAARGQAQRHAAVLRSLEHERTVPTYNPKAEVQHSPPPGSNLSVKA